jgi:hypothetical protein
LPDAFRAGFDRGRYRPPEEIAAAFKRLFGGKGDAEVVLEHLAKVCWVYRTPDDCDPNVALRLQGRRDVWVVIENLVTMKDEEIRAVSATQEGRETE